MKIRKIPVVRQSQRLRVAVYCRVSTRHTEQEDSLEVQQSAYLNYIRTRSDWELVGIYSDTRSGLNADRREGFMQMIEDAQAGKIDLILCKSVSRFSRNIIECQRYTEMLRSRNVAVIFEKEHLRTDEPTSNLIFSLMCAIAQDESRSISENIKIANRHKIEAGIYTPRKNQMLGYDTKNGKLVPNENAWIVRLVFREYAKGTGLNEICRALNAQGAERHWTKKPFTHQVLSYMLINESYIGDKRLQKQAPINFITKKPDPNVAYATNYLTDDHEAIVSREVWDKVQERLKREADERGKNIHRHGNSHELFRRVTCGCCGQPYIRKSYRIGGSKAIKQEMRHVWCCKGRSYGSGCKNPNIREKILEEKMFGIDTAVISTEGTVIPLSVKVPM